MVRTERGSRGVVNDVGGDAGDRLDTQKKTPVATEQDRPDVIEKRAAFVTTQQTLCRSRLVFVDESGFRLGSVPRHGWAPRGVDANGKTPGKWTPVTMIGAIALDGLRGLMTLESGTTNDVFEMFVSDALVPNLHPGDIVVMDNLSSHKQPRVKALIEAKECSVLFTPPYSPEFNPIEEAWAKLKDILRRMNTATREAFDSALDEALTAITSSDLLGWFEHAGYRFEST